MSKCLVNDFVVETKGHCFLCLEQIISQSCVGKIVKKSNPIINEAATRPVHSIQCLSRYLKVDMTKVFVEGGAIPPDLAANVRRSNLKVELCEKCFLINNEFSKYYRQLDKAQMRMDSLLKFVRDKVKDGGGGVGKRQQLEKSLDSKEKIQIVEALRTEALENCIQKLANCRPTVHIQNLSMKWVIKERQKINRQIACKTDRYNNEDVTLSESLSHPNSDQASDYNGTKIEPLFDNLTEDDNDDHRMDDDWKEVEGPRPQLEVRNNDLEREKIVKAEPSDPMEADNQTQNQPSTSNQTDALTNQFLKAIPPPIGKPNGKYRKDPGTGKYKCQLCSNEYVLLNSFMRHYRSAHLKVKYKCGYCEKIFSYKTCYDEHYQNVHMGVRYKCNDCSGVFSVKRSLEIHRKKFHSKMRLLPVNWTVNVF